MQVNELGVLEMRIAPTISRRRHLRQCVDPPRVPPSRRPAGSATPPAVLECNDGFLNHIQADGVTEADVDAAIAAAAEDFACPWARAPE